MQNDLSCNCKFRKPYKIPSQILWDKCFFLPQGNSSVQYCFPQSCALSEESTVQVSIDLIPDYSTYFFFCVTVVSNSHMTRIMKHDFTSYNPLFLIIYFSLVKTTHISLLTFDNIHMTIKHTT